MDLQLLLDRLRDGDPAHRIEALRILAMVEETQALKAVAWVYKNDPAVQVRQAAQWAGQLLWQAQQRGHSTAQAIQQHYARSGRSDHEEMLIDEVSSPTFTGKRALDQKFLAESEIQARQRELLDALHEKPADAGDLSLSDLAFDLLNDDPSKT